MRASWGQRFEKYLRNDVLATQHMLEAMRTAGGGRRLAYASSSPSTVRPSNGTAETLRPEPHSPYGTRKLAGEHLCTLYHANHGVETVSLRYFTVYGPWQRPDMAFSIFCSAALTGDEIRVYGDGRQTRDFIYAEDIVVATRSATQVAQAAGQVFNIGGGSRTSLGDVLALVERFAGRPLDVSYIEVQEGDVRDTAADTSAARATLDLVASTDLATGLEAEFLWVREELARPARR